MGVLVRYQLDEGKSLSHSPGKIVRVSFGGFRVPGTSAYSDLFIIISEHWGQYTKHERFEDKIDPRVMNP
ncbi:hypothetical protein M413DRAFT_444948 [Hebeloma cylindrosporum]|uniref:Uncharacterized protein n=1 Tax=Hebeloma cylindrosporum TaxID=76867 RepID=A0A0C3CDP1_HEBCY|nr:hypothetical protein M413DRAFT_444948 [Hebeloma cylindrosporum h7]